MLKLLIVTISTISRQKSVFCHSINLRDVKYRKKNLLQHFCKLFLLRSLQKTVWLIIRRNFTFTFISMVPRCSKLNPPYSSNKSLVDDETWIFIAVENENNIKLLIGLDSFISVLQATNFTHILQRVMKLTVYLDLKKFKRQRCKNRDAKNKDANFWKMEAKIIRNLRKLK